MKQTFWCHLLIIVIITMPISQSNAAEQLPSPIVGGQPIADSEWKMLPEYCVDTQGLKYGKGKSPNSAKWVATLGERFWTLHHYCIGLVKFNRAQRFGSSKVVRNGYLAGALSDFLFVTKQMPADYILAPEILTYVGRTHLLLDQPTEAAVAFTMAQRSKPDYWPAYSWWATYLANHGKAQEARAVAAEGVLRAPDSRTLQSILRSLDRDQASGTNRRRD